MLTNYLAHVLTHSSSFQYVETSLSDEMCSYILQGVYTHNISLLGLQTIKDNLDWDYQDTQ